MCYKIRANLVLVAGRRRLKSADERIFVGGGLVVEQDQVHLLIVVDDALR